VLDDEGADGELGAQALRQRVQRHQRPLGLGAAAAGNVFPQRPDDPAAQPGHLRRRLGVGLDRRGQRGLDHGAGLGKA